MTLFNSTAAFAPRDGLVRLVSRSIRAVFATLERRRKVRMTRHTLHDLPNWILRDIGIHRSEIESLMVDYDAALRDDENSTIPAWDGGRP